jgi:hypothetical protein
MKDDDEKMREAKRTLDRIGQEGGLSATPAMKSAANSVREHFSAADADKTIRLKCGAPGLLAGWHLWRWLGWSGSCSDSSRNDQRKSQWAGHSSGGDRDLESCGAWIGRQPGGSVRAGNTGLSGLGTADSGSSLASRSFPCHPNRAWKRGILRTD